MLRSTKKIQKGVLNANSLSSYISYISGGGSTPYGSSLLHGSQRNYYKYSSPKNVSEQQKAKILSEDKHAKTGTKRERLVKEAEARQEQNETFGADRNHAQQERNAHRAVINYDRNQGSINQEQADQGKKDSDAAWQSRVEKNQGKERP